MRNSAVIHLNLPVNLIYAASKHRLLFFLMQVLYSPYEKAGFMFPFKDNLTPAFDYKIYQCAS